MPTPQPRPPAGRKPRKRLAPSEKYEIFVQVLTGQATQREAAERFGVDRSTVVHVCRVAKQGALDALAASVPGRPGHSPEQAELAAARVLAGLDNLQPRVLDTLPAAPAGDALLEEVYTEHTSRLATAWGRLRPSQRVAAVDAYRDAYEQALHQHVATYCLRMTTPSGPTVLV